MICVLQLLSISSFGIVLSLLAYSIYILNTLNTNVETNLGKLDLQNYYILTTKLNQFKNTHSNNMTLYFQENTKIKKLVHCILILNNIYPEYDKYRTEYELQVNKYGQNLFNKYNKRKTYIPIENNRTVYFTNYCELNFIHWVIESGLFKEIVDNKDNLIDRLISSKVKED